MQERHIVLKIVYTEICDQSLDAVFGEKITNHAGLQLRWIKDDFQNREIGSCDEYQIVIAKVEAGQRSQPHLHEVGASSFLVLGKKVGLPYPMLKYYAKRFTEDFVWGPQNISDVREGTLRDIFPYEVHSFRNGEDTPAYLLIVAHPIIYIKEGMEDIHLVEPIR